MKKHRMMFLDGDAGDGGAGSSPSGSLVDGGGTPPPAAATAGGQPNGGTPAAAASPVAGGWINPDGTFTPDWTGRLPEEMRAEAESLKKYGNVTDLTRGFINAQRLIGKKGIILPTEKSTPEEIAEFRKQMGVPDTVEGYQAKPEQLPEGIDWSDDLAKPFLSIAHKHNIPKAALKELIGAHIQMESLRSQEFNRAATEQLTQKYNEGINTLQTSWGKDFDTNRRKVAAIAAAEGIPLDSPGFSDPNMAKLIFNLSKHFAEDKIIAAGNQVLSGSADQLANDIQTNPDNPLHKAYLEGRSDAVEKVRAYRKQAEKDRQARG